MSTFLLRRLISIIPVLLGILLVTFSMARLIPGDPCHAILGERATDEICDDFIRRNGLDKPIPEQFVIYLRNVLRGDLGESIRFGRNISELMAERLPTTFELSFNALLFATFLGVPMGILSAYKRNSGVDMTTMMGANIGVSMPVFWLGLMLAYIFGVLLKDTPLALPPSGRLSPGLSPEPFYEAWGWADSKETAAGWMVFISRFNSLNALLTQNWNLVWDSFRHMILPAITVGTIPLAIVARMTRSSLVEVLNQDYVRTARAKGLHERTVVLRHATRNALLPVVTIIGLNFGHLLSGAIMTETIFGLTGVGRTMYDGITTRDYTLIQGATLTTAVVFVLINTLVDILYGFLDPRIRLS